VSSSPLVPVAPGVLVATSRVMRTTTTLVVRDRCGVLVDPAWRPDELASLADDLDALGIRVTAGVSTHPHHDHLLWHPSFGDVPRWASARAVDVVAAHRDALRAALLADQPADGAAYPADVLALFGRVTPLPGTEEVGSVIPVPAPFAPPDTPDTPDDVGTATDPGPGPDPDPDPVELITHDAHAPGHVAVRLPARGVLLVGDMLSDVELPLPFDPDDLPAYLAGLDVLAPHVAHATVLVPGHGTPTYEPLARLDADRRYLDDVLAGRTPDDPRLADPEMARVHDRLVALAEG